MKCLSVSVIRGFQYEEWNEMYICLLYVVSNMRNEMKCSLSVCHTWIPIWGIKWNVCPSVKRGFQYEEWNEMSLCHTWFPIWGMKWNVCPSVIRGFQYEEWNEMSVRLSYVVSNMRDEMKCLSVSVIRGFQYEEWNEMYICLLYVVSNMRNEMKCSLSVCHTWIPIWGIKWNVCLSVIRGFPIWGMKWNICPSVIRGFQYEERNEMSVRLSHSCFPIWGMKWNVYLSVIRGFQYEEWNEM